MADVFEVVDKSGRKIRLTRERWKHITTPTSPHAYMTNYLEEIKQTLENPDKVVISVYDDKKGNYYKYYKYNKKYLRVAVKYLNGTGFVITAYFVRNIEK
ncbi:MAG: PBECR2 nuclease fold domain-containing protein [Nanoarchaeota archaeon]|nr:PBECR2 nuclease fold domain-containing protein [Nanoarchaeota archaeon]